MIKFGKLNKAFVIFLLQSQCIFSKHPSSKPASQQNEIALLKQQIAILSDKVHALEKKESEIHYKEKVTQTDQAPIQMVQSGNDKAKLKISGFINRGMAYYDNGRNSEWKHVDVNEAPSRINVSAEASFNKDLKVGTVLEMAVKSNSSDEVDIGQVDNSASSVTFTKRKIEIFFNHVRYGMISLGHGETAANYVSGVDLTGTDMFSQGADLATFAGGVRFIRGNVNQESLLPVPGSNQTDSLSPDRDRQVAEVWTDIMGARRKDRVRYDTPTYYGFTLSAAHATRDLTDYAIRYAGEWSKVQVAAAFGYAHVPFSQYLGNTGTRTVRKGRDEYGGSIFFLLPSGISFGGSAAAKNYKDPGRRKGTLWTGKAGYQHLFMPDWGNTCFAVTYGQGRALFDNTTSAQPSSYTATTFLEDNSEKVKIYGAYLVQNLDKIATEIFMGIQYHHLKRLPYGQSALLQEKGYGFKRILATMIGARVKF